MAVAAILADAKFEEHDDIKTWNVIGSYNFDSQQFTITTLQAVTGETSSPKMVMCINPGDKAPSGDQFIKQADWSSVTFNSKYWAEFNTSAGDNAIGKVGTSGTAYYSVQITAQDFDTSVDWSKTGT